MTTGIRLSIVIEIPDSENDSIGNLSRKINKDPKKYLSSDFVKIGGAAIEKLVSGGGQNLVEDDYEEIEKEIEEAEENIEPLKNRLNDLDKAMMEYYWDDE